MVSGSPCSNERIEASNSDLNASMSANLDVTSSKSAVESPPRKVWWRRGLFHACVFSAALLFVMTFLLWPRDPEWNLSGLDIDTNKFIGIMAGQGNVSEPMSLSADITLWNPNFVGTHTKSGDFLVYYGSDVMSHGVVNEADVGARALSSATANITVTLNKALSQRIMADVIANDFALTVRADVHLVAGLGPFGIRIHAVCDVTAATKVLLSRPLRAEELLSKKQCTYSYGL